VLRGSLRGVERRGREEGSERGREGHKGKGRKGDVDSDAKLLPTRLNR